MFATLGRLVVRRPWWVIAAWVLLAVVVVVSVAPKIKSSSDEASFLPSHHEWIQAQNLQRSAFSKEASPAAIVVIERADGAALTAADSTTVARIDAALNAASSTSRVASCFHAEVRPAHSSAAVAASIVTSGRADRAF